jgi:hypothetical protein
MPNKREELKITSLERLKNLMGREKGNKAPKRGFTAPPGAIHYPAKRTRKLGRLSDKPNYKLTQGCKNVLIEPCHPLLKLWCFLCG